MPSTVIINNMTAAHAASNGISQAFPDVCKTPAAPSPLPIPYPNIAMSSDAADGASSVTADGNPIMVSTSKYAMSSGDEAGSLMGVVSNKVKGSANPQMYSFDVKAEGKNVFRQLDIMLQNGGSKAINTPPGPNNQPPGKALPKGADPKKMKIKEVKWSSTKQKCGDEVKLETKTENFKNGSIVPHVIFRKATKSKRKKKGSSEEKIDTLSGKIKGDATEMKWITRNGTWQKTTTEHKARATGVGGPILSSNVLQIEIPPEKQDTVTVLKANNTARAIVGWKIPFTGRAIGSPKGKLYGNGYGYDISIKQGVFQVHTKIELDVQPGVQVAHLTQWKKQWKQEAETVWDNKWKEHRKACKRGKKCNCPGGCCIFPIRVKCSFVGGGGHVKVKLHPGPASYPNAWWNAANWYEQLSGQEGNGAVVHAHEFGHNMGMWDEYPGGAVKAKFYDVKGSIMQSGTNVMIQHWNEHPEAGKSIHKWFSDAVGEEYELSPI